MNSNKLVMSRTWLDMARYGYGNIMSHTGTKSFLPLNKTWITTLFLTLMNTAQLYSWCSVRVEKEGIQFNNWEDNRKCVENVSTHWLEFQLMDGEIHD